MNKYRDQHLDAKGVERLDGIIALHQSDPNSAMRALDQLIVAYPKSAQLWISKGYFTKTNDIQDRKRCFAKAAETNDNFYDAYRHWASCIRIEPCSYYGGTPMGRNRFMAGLIGLAKTPEKERLHLLGCQHESVMSKICFL